MHLVQMSGKSGPVRLLRGSSQMRKELFIRDCGVLSFTTIYFPSFHHATIVPTFPYIPFEAWAKCALGYKYSQVFKKLEVCCILLALVYFCQFIWPDAKTNNICSKSTAVVLTH